MSVQSQRAIIVYAYDMPKTDLFIQYHLRTGVTGERMDRNM